MLLAHTPNLAMPVLPTWPHSSHHMTVCYVRPCIH
ncbi:hypothetical protein F383_32261 [Gossypium arboreum]|uniref:Uncharacterized protein n=1 Tax=Gossypium arboreum TaxID=29729 RepID=A0A0B0PHZ5_GOSAR|nr:hypothetical protein F383_32261 [Gossypium arboreum]